MILIGIVVQIFGIITIFNGIITIIKASITGDWQSIYIRLADTIGATTESTIMQTAIGIATPIIIILLGIASIGLGYIIKETQN